MVLRSERAVDDVRFDAEILDALLGMREMHAQQIFNYRTPILVLLDGQPCTYKLLGRRCDEVSSANIIAPIITIQGHG